MKFVVKLGGAALEKPELLIAIGKAITNLVADGNQVAIVHGGGVQLTKTLALMGKKSEFISGLRVTDAETRDVALMVLAGRVNKSLVAALGQQGQSAVGISGGDGHVFVRGRENHAGPRLRGRDRGHRSALAGCDLEDGRGASHQLNCARF